MNNAWRFLLVLALWSSLLVGCSQYKQVSSLGDHRLIDIPYIEGDSSGLFTTQLIKEFTLAFPSQYSSQAPLALKVRIVDEYEDNIGFEYEKDDSGNLLDKIIPSENRLTLIAQVTIVEKNTGKVVFGPEKIKTSQEFDYNFDAIKDQQMASSLGQLNGLNEARDGAKMELTSQLAKKIIYVLQELY